MRPFLPCLLLCACKSDPIPLVPDPIPGDSANVDTATKDTAATDTGTKDTGGEDPTPPGRPWEGTLPIGSLPARTWLGEAAGDRAGRTVEPAEDLNGDGYADLLLGAYYSSSGAFRGGKAYMLLGPLSAGVGDLSAVETTIVGEAEIHFVSRSMAGVGDATGDGVADLLVGAPNDQVDGAWRACLFEGPLEPGERGIFDGESCIYGYRPGGLAGGFVSGPGDMDGDGIAELAIGAFFSDTGGTNAGELGILPGPPVAGSSSLEDAQARWVGAANSEAGWFHGAGGDLDGDGYQDLIVGAPTSNTSLGTITGAVYIIYGPPSAGQHALVEAGAVIEGVDLSGRAGSALAGGQDLTGDGAPDLLVGIPGADDENGRVRMLPGPLARGVHDLAAGPTWAGAIAGGAAGWGVAEVGDLDGDGRGEILVGAFGGESTEDPDSAAYLLYGPGTGTSSLADADAIFQAEGPGDYLGWYLDRAGDMDGDGRDDLVIGAQRRDEGGEEAGKVYLLLSRAK